MITWSSSIETASFSASEPNEPLPADGISAPFGFSAVCPAPGPLLDRRQQPRRPVGIEAGIGREESAWCPPLSANSSEGHRAAFGSIGKRDPVPAARWMLAWWSPGSGVKTCGLSLCDADCRERPCRDLCCGRLWNGSYFPMQKVEKIRPKRSSEVKRPVISPSAFCAWSRSSAMSSAPTPRTRAACADSR